jgi:hypothetical protein
MNSVVRLMDFDLDAGQLPKRKHERASRQGLAP